MHRVKDLFAAAVDLKDASDRERFLDQECVGEPDLRHRVELLLQAYDQPSTRAASPDPGFTREHQELPPEDEHTRATRVADDTLHPYSTESRAGEILDGKYKLIEQIGEGGMGTVWMAEQTTPVKRLVAVKLIRAGMDSKMVLARFEAERQALALMDHPNIAKVLDAGQTQNQHPYFVMELVKGIPITEYCDEMRLTPRQRLQLLVPVCQAVQHAHQKGIIHRDLKPTNVLVALYDGHPVPKVIDFGIAKATSQQLTERTLVTGYGVVVGTPEYMSPEQASLNQVDIDTRSDIYSLGVLTYELLTGSPPFSEAELSTGGLLEALRLIREQEPVKPSTRLSTSRTLPQLADKRGTTPSRLSSLVRGELDWIVMKALEKRRERRYETAEGLADDLHRYLQGQSVRAVPPSAIYRASKFLDRHRVPVFVAILILVGLIATSVGTTWGLLRAEAARKEANDARKTEAQQRQLAEQQRDRARKEQARANEQAAVANAVKDFLQNKLLGQASATRGGKPSNPTVLELLDRTAREMTEAKLQRQFPDHPQVQVELLETVGMTYLTIGKPEKALPHLELGLKLSDKHFGPTHENTRKAVNNLAQAYRKAGADSRATELLRSRNPRDS